MVYEYELKGIIYWIFIKEKDDKPSPLFDISIKVGKLIFPRFNRYTHPNRFYYRVTKDSIKYIAVKRSKQMGKMHMRKLTELNRLFYFIPNK